MIATIIYANASKYLRLLHSVYVSVYIVWIGKFILPIVDSIFFARINTLLWLLLWVVFLFSMCECVIWMVNYKLKFITFRICMYVCVCACYVNYVNYEQFKFYFCFLFCLRFALVESYWLIRNDVCSLQFSSSIQWWWCVVFGSPSKIVLRSSSNRAITSIIDTPNAIPATWRKHCVTAEFSLCAVVSSGI